MKYPLLIGEPTYNISPYFSIEHIRCYLEPKIIQEGVVAYDCEGRLLKLACEDLRVEKKSFFGKKIIETFPQITIIEQETTPTHADEITIYLRDHFAYAYQEDPCLVSYLDQEQLPTLINRMVRCSRVNYQRFPQQIRAAGFCYPLTIQVDSAYEINFDSLQQAENSLSPRIARDGLYSGFDGEGRRLVVEPYKKNKVVISLIEGIAMEPVSDGKK